MIRIMLECLFFSMCGVSVGSERDLFGGNGFAKLALVILGIYVFFISGI